jgi:integrase
MKDFVSNNPITQKKRYRSANGERRIYKDGTRYKLKDVIELPDGTRVEFVGSGKTRSSCEANTRKLRAKRLRELECLNVDRNLLGDFCRHWIDNVKEPSGLRPNTISSYRFALARLIRPYIGQIPLAQLTRQDVRELYSTLSKLGKTYYSLKDARAVLCGALEEAYSSGLVASNVARGVKLPKRPANRPVHFSAEEVRKILEVAETNELKARWVLAFAIGLRQGEALGLKWDCVDLEGSAPHVKISRTLSRVHGKGLVLGPVKSQSSDRLIPLSNQLVGVLKKHRTKQQALFLKKGITWRPSSFVFTTEFGSPIDPANDRKNWIDLLRKSGVIYRKLHAARHTTATLLHSADTPLLTISKLLGHSSISTTAEFYAHVETSSKLRAINTLEAVINY